MKTTILAAACALGLAGLSTAETINVPGDYPTIVGAIDSADHGDVILVAAGVYQEASTVIFDDRDDVTLSGAVNKDGSPAVTILQPLDGGRMVLVGNNGSDNGRIENIIFDGANGGSTGQVVYVNNVSGTEIHNCIFRNCTSGRGALAIWSTHMTVSNCMFENNWASNGGAIHIYQSASATITGSTFTGNTAQSLGGVAYFEHFETVEFVDCVMTGNTAGQRGGAIYTNPGNGWQSSLLLNNTLISNNTAITGGGLNIMTGSVSGGEVYGNTANYGGGVCFENVQASIVGMTVRDNVAVHNGGGVYTAYGVEEYPDVIASTICGNTPNQVWHIEGDNTNIINESCESNPAACCVNGACIMVEPLMCDDVGGTLSNGGEEDCSSTECAEPCLGDVNNDSEINVNDLLTVIANWGGCP